MISNIYLYITISFRLKSAYNVHHIWCNTAIVCHTALVHQLVFIAISFGPMMQHKIFLEFILCVKYVSVFISYKLALKASSVTKCTNIIGVYNIRWYRTILLILGLQVEKTCFSSIRLKLFSDCTKIRTWKKKLYYNQNTTLTLVGCAMSIS